MVCKPLLLRRFHLSLPSLMRHTAESTCSLWCNRQYTHIYVQYTTSGPTPPSGGAPTWPKWRLRKFVSVCEAHCAAEVCTLCCTALRAALYRGGTALASAPHSLLHSSAPAPHWLRRSTAAPQVMVAARCRSAQQPSACGGTPTGPPSVAATQPQVTASTAMIKLCLQ